MKGKYSSTRDAYLDELALMGWADATDGDVDSPTGWFALFLNDESAQESIAQSFPAATVIIDDLLGYFLLEVNEDGFVNVEEFDTPEEAREEYDWLRGVYAAWVETGEYEGDE